MNKVGYIILGFIFLMGILGFFVTWNLGCSPGGGGNIQDVNIENANMYNINAQEF